MGGAARRGAVAGMVAVLALSMIAEPAGAGTRPVTPEFVGVQDDWAAPPDPSAWGTARVWAAWCTVQPTAETDATSAASARLTRAFTTYAATSATRLTISLGHPAPWVFDNHPKALKRAKYVWFCGAKRANTSFPTAASLRRGPVGQVYADYVAAVIGAARPYLDANPANRLVLQAWNEPNLRNGGTVKRAVPGSARTWKQASASLREQERIMRRVAAGLIPGRFEITTPSLYGKPTALGRRYLADQAKRPTVDSISLNFYTLRQRSVNKSLSLWRVKAARAKRLVTKHKRLRKLPIWLTETNHNLINGIPSDANVTGRWTAPEAQRRMVEVTTMEALRQGFAGVQWYQGAPRQTAVNTRPGTPATEASKALMSELLGRRLTKCRTRKKVTTCTLSAREDSGRIRVRWSSRGTDGVTILR